MFGKIMSWNCCYTSLLEGFNAQHAFPLISDLVKMNYFRYYKVNLNRECEFWPEEKKCVLKNCNVDSCTENNAEKDHETCSIGSDLPLHNVDTGLSPEEMKMIKELGSEDKSIDFIQIKDYLEDSQYVDLVKNPERYTGYAGQGSAKIWRSIFQENCLTSKQKIINGNSSETCLEFQIISRILSGFRTSVGIHASSRFPLESNRFQTTWGINYESLEKRFAPENTDSQGSRWIQDTFFAYSIVHRAILKSSPLWLLLDIKTGSSLEDKKTKEMIKEFMVILEKAPGTFREQVMFTDVKTTPELMESIRITFQNISQILDCVACDKCRLWGKVQIQGFATSLKILFTPSKGLIKQNLSPAVKLNRMEIVSLFNLFSRLSTSLDYLYQWRQFLEINTSP
ncbi:hypothetical protein HZS_2155, partial [Henneguya salminicola]